MHSPLQQPYTANGQTVEIHIYKFKNDAEWVLEVVAADGTSTVWDDKFPSDKSALDEAMRAIQQEGIESFLADEEPPLTIH